MAKYENSPFITLRPYKPDVQHEGQAAGGRGTYGRIGGDGENHRQPYSPSGEFGPSVANGQVSGTAQSLIAKSTGVKVNDGRNPPIYGKKSVY